MFIKPVVTHCLCKERENGVSSACHAALRLELKCYLKYHVIRDLPVIQVTPAIWDLLQLILLPPMYSNVGIKMTLFSCFLF